MRLAIPIAAAALVLAVPAAAKEFEPGDLQLCNATRCVPIVDQTTLTAFGAFFYGSRNPMAIPAPRLGVPCFELRSRNGYVTGIVASRRLDRFLSYGVNTNQFARGRWYRVPARTALELRWLSASLEPLRLTRAALRKSR
jgi:hypothetical protein